MLPLYTSANTDTLNINTYILSLLLTHESQNQFCDFCFMLEAEPRAMFHCPLPVFVCLPLFFSVDTRVSLVKLTMCIQACVFPSLFVGLAVFGPVSPVLYFVFCFTDYSCFVACLFLGGGEYWIFDFLLGYPLVIKVKPDNTGRKLVNIWNDRARDLVFCTFSI